MIYKKRGTGYTKGRRRPYVHLSIKESLTADSMETHTHRKRVNSSRIIQVMLAATSKGRGKAQTVSLTCFWS